MKFKVKTLHLFAVEPERKWRLTAGCNGIHVATIIKCEYGQYGVVMSGRSVCCEITTARKDTLEDAYEFANKIWADTVNFALIEKI